MNRYNPTNVRHRVAALICTVLFSATCLVAAAGPVSATPATDEGARSILSLA